VFLVSGSGVSIGNASPVTYEHNVSPQVMLSPENGVRSPINISTLFSFRCVNNGSQDEANVPIVISIFNNSGAPPFRDTLRIKSWKHGQTIDTFFREYTPLWVSTYTIKIITLLETDENAPDDTLISKFTTRYEKDAAAVSIFSPKMNDEIIQGSLFKLQGKFQSNGYGDLYDVPARVEIRRCEDGYLMFRSDSTIPDLITDDPLVTFSFPAKQGAFNVVNLKEGCYKIAMIVRLSTDADRRNDTAYSTFDILPNPLTNNIVGVEIFSPLQNAVFHKNDVVPITAHYKNIGKLDQPAVKLFATVLDTSKKVIYKDSVTFLNWKHGETQIVNFRQFKATQYGNLFFTVHSSLASDENVTDDTLRSSFKVVGIKDLQLQTITMPAKNQTIPYGRDLSIKVMGEWKGDYTLDWAKLKVIVSTCTKDSVVYDRTAVTSAMHPDEGLKELFIFLNDNGLSREIPKGCYRLTLIADLSDDVDRSNDTLKQIFTIGTGIKESVDSILYPQNHTNIGSALSSAKVRCLNDFAGGDLELHFFYTVLNGQQQVYYINEVAVGDWPVDVAKVIDLDILGNMPKGYYTIKVEAWPSSDIAQKKTVGEATFYVGIPGLDLAPTQIIDPTPESSIAFGKRFEPTVTYDWQGGYYYDSMQVAVIIRDCSNQLVVYECRKKISPLSRENNSTVISFPDIIDSYNTASLQRGCYEITATAELPNDGRRIQSIIQ